MKIVVCIRKGLDGEISPFDASAYETGLRLGGEITLLSMGPENTVPFLQNLTRLGASRAVLLSDKIFAGADTLATAYALAQAMKKLQPDLILCGRQTLVGDTGQTGPMLAELLQVPAICNVMQIDNLSDTVVCTNRSGIKASAPLPTLITMERICDLRLPRLLAKIAPVEIWSAADIDAAPEKCGLSGSPTRVMQTFENTGGKRKCKFISPDQFLSVVEENRTRISENVSDTESKPTISKICIVGESPRSYAQSVCENILCLPLSDADTLCKQICKETPRAVLWGSDDHSKQIAAQVAARLNLGLCADCTHLEADGDELIMYRPALSGQTLAKIVSRTMPAMATVRTVDDNTKSVVLGIGFGAKDHITELTHLAEKLNGDIGASRKMVDQGHLPYIKQVGLTGRTVSPAVYVAIGISGAVHHIAGMQYSGIVVAVNADKNAPIFDYADYGIVADVEEFLSAI